jgi:2-phospho-L-lactate guanylyltransferase
MAEPPAVVIAVKALAGAKSRLRVLGDEACEALVLAMLQDVLASVRGVHEGALFVLSADERYEEAAGRHHAVPLPDGAPGYREAVPHALRVPPLAAAPGVLVLPADLPCMQPDDVAMLLAGLREPGVVLVASADGGTSALGLHPPGAIPVAFGRDSARKHRRLARAAGLPLHEFRLDRLAVDVDTVEDLARVAGRCDPATARVLLETGALASIGATS